MRESYLMAAPLLRPAMLPSGLPRRIEPVASPTLPIVDAESQAAWAKWLAKNQGMAAGVWVRVGKEGGAWPGGPHEKGREGVLGVVGSAGKKKVSEGGGGLR